MIEIQLLGMKLKNPLILASGILGSRSSSLNRIAENAGAVITKSVGLEPREGYRNPTVINWNCGLINAVGLASPPAIKFAEELKKFTHASPLIVSLYGYSPEDFSELVKLFPMADAFEINLSCPHVSKAGFDIGKDIELSVEIARYVKKNTEKPVIAKISAMHDYIELAKALEKDIDAVTISNTLKGMKIDIVSRRPILSNISGGVSGEAIKPLALKCVYDLYEEIDIPIIGCGGVVTFRDVIEFMLAGASAVEIGSAVFYSGRIFYSLKESLIAYARATGEPLQDLVGLAHR
jgi:dihydroorotate dehydrogenase (NAD+) catalytic subunit